MSERIRETLNYLKVPDGKQQIYLKDFEENGVNDSVIVSNLETSQNDELLHKLQDILPMKLYVDFLDTFQRIQVQAVDLKNCKLVYSTNSENNGCSELSSSSSSSVIKQNDNIQHDNSLATSYGQKRLRLTPSENPTISNSTTTTTTCANLITTCNTTTTTTTLSPLHDYSKWISLTGSIKSEDIIQPLRFIEIQPILNPPASISSLLQNQQKSTSPTFPRLTSYLLQRIKMWGPQVISASKLYSQFHKNSRSSAVARKRTSQGQGSSSSYSNASVRRLDYLNYLTSVLHPIVMQDVFRILSLFPVALPLVIPSMGKTVGVGGSSSDDDNNNNNDTCAFKILIPLLRNCTIRWTEGSQTIENHLFSSPLKMIGALRIGSGNNLVFAGKSSFLNELLKDKYAFSSKKEPGSKTAQPLSLAGTIEFIPLTEETCEKSFWELIKDEDPHEKNSNQVLLLANLHGDSLDSRLEDHVKFLHRICTSLVLFFMPDNTDDDDEDGNDRVNNRVNSSLKEREEKIKSKLKKYEDETKKNMTNNTNNKKNSGKKNDKLLTKLFKLYIDPSDKIFEEYEEISIFSTKFGDDENIEVVRDVFKSAIDAPTKQWKPDDNILNCGKLQNVEEIETEESRILTTKIQSLTNDEINKLMTLQNDTDSTEAQRLLHINETMKTQSPELRKRQKNRDQIFYYFLKILNQTSSDRQNSMEHLESFLFRLSNSSSSSSFSGGRRQLTITTVHLFREMMTIYDNLMTSSLSQTDPPFINHYRSNVPEKVAELLLEGQSIELYNADKGIERMSKSWLDNVLCHICQRLPKLRVFVVSILGIQSTGKSTLLNALFGCKFAVSAGSCTKGVFMKLVFLEKKYAEEQGFDAVILIDTEGLYSPEKANDADAAELDRKISTFVIALSNLTLININGEASLPILNILQIVIVTLGRLRKVGLEPSDLLVLQHSMEKNESRHSTADAAFRKNLQDAIQIVREYPIKYNLSRDYKKVMENWEKSISSPDLKMEFSAFKGGSGKASAPPSEAYHDDVIRLYSKIMERGKNGHQWEFQKWFARIYEVMQSISEQDFTLRFKDILEMQEFLQRGERIAAVQEKITLALREHKELLKTELAALLDDPQYKNGNEEQKEEKKKNIIDKIENFLDKCQTHPQQQQQQQEQQENLQQQQKDNSQQEQQQDVENLQQQQQQAENLQQQQQQDVEMTENIESSPPPSSSSQCQKCTIAYEALTKLENESKKKPYEHHLLDTMRNHKQNIIELTQSELTTFLQYQQEDRNVNDLIQDEIIKFLKDVLSDESNITKVHDEPFRTECTLKIFEIVRNKLSEIPLKKFKEPIFREVYDSLPQELKDKLSEDFLKNLGQFQSTSNFSPSPSPSTFEDVRIFNSSLPLGAQLTVDQKTQLYNESRRLVRKVLEEKNLKTFELSYGLPSTLNRKMQELLYDFQAKHGDFLDIFLVWEKVLLVFLSKIYKIEENWLKSESPSAKFEKHLGNYEFQIETILQYGFTPKSAGILCGDRLRQEILAEAKLFSEKQHLEYILCRKWFASVENTRLLYFSELARKIKSIKDTLGPRKLNSREYNDAIREGIDHFRDPSRSIRIWLYNKMNDFPNDRRKKNFKSYFKDEMARVKKKVKEAATIQQIRELEREHFQKSGLYAADIEVVLDENEVEKEENILMYQQSALKEMQYHMNYIMSNVEFVTTSDDSQLSSKIGCTACCKFCGAICWGAQGHSNNTDDSRFHFAPHQPQGFCNGTSDTTKELMATTCYENQDEETHFWGNRTRRGATWAETKAHKYYSDWKYTRHPNSSYNELMLWLLVLLNVALAEDNSTKVDIVKPNSQIKNMQLRDLNMILRDIETTVGVLADE